MKTLRELAGNTDIYLLDQILKGRYTPGQKILDAGCGSGRNLHWFTCNGFLVIGTDVNQSAIALADHNFKQNDQAKFLVAEGSSLPFPDAEFDHVISSAVLHFCKDHQNFEQQFGELVRVMKPSGSLFIRMTTDIGFQDSPGSESGVLDLPDGSRRYVLTIKLLNALIERHQMRLLEDLKSVVVYQQRSMGVIVLGKI